MIGKTDLERRRVVNTSYDCLMSSIRNLRPGVLLSEIGTIIETVAEERHCRVLTQFVVHGVGIDFHEQPQIPH